jgi:hypothetical protein
MKGPVTKKTQCYAGGSYCDTHGWINLTKLNLEKNKTWIREVPDFNLDRGTEIFMVYFVFLLQLL